MNKFLFAFGFLLTLCNPIYPQEATQNYIRTRVMLNESGSSYMDEIVYYDGLGRPFQTVRLNRKGCSCVMKESRN